MQSLKQQVFLGVKTNLDRDVCGKKHFLAAQREIFFFLNLHKHVN